jgi:hypothetical protein
MQISVGRPIHFHQLKFAIYMTLYSTLHPKTQALIDATKEFNSRLKMPVDGRYLLINATIPNGWIPYADPDDLLAPGIYKAFVPVDLSDGLAARCAFEAFNCLVPIRNLAAIELSFIDPELEAEIEVNFETEINSMELGNRCLGFEQYVAGTYSLFPKPFPVANLFR